MTPTSHTNRVAHGATLSAVTHPASAASPAPACSSGLRRGSNHPEPPVFSWPGRCMARPSFDDAGSRTTALPFQREPGRGRARSQTGWSVRTESSLRNPAGRVVSPQARLDTRHGRVWRGTPRESPVTQLCGRRPRRMPGRSFQAALSHAGAQWVQSPPFGGVPGQGELR